jgi:polysaccharide biosynthesis protein PslH
MTSTTHAVPRAPALLQRRSRTPRILYLSPYYPYRTSGASEVRVLNIGRALQEFGRVEMIVVEGEGGREEWAQMAEKPFDIKYGVPVEARPNTTVWQKLRWATDTKMPYPHGCGVDTASLQRVMRTAADFDLVWFFKLRTANMFPQWSWKRAVVDIDDVPSTFVKSVLETELPTLERIKAIAQLRSWQRRERRLGERFSVLGVCSEQDKRYLQDLGVQAPVHVLPNGADPPAIPPVRRVATPPRLGFIGIFDYEPNRAGIEWFVRDCWPLVKREVPAARLRLVGRLSDSQLKPEGEDIDGLGFLPDVADEINSWSAMVVPVRAGAGTRGKIAHGFSLKCPIVSTSLGAYGYDARDGHTMSLADSAEAFAAACVAAIRNPAAADAMAERAWREFLEKWTWNSIQPRIWAAADECLRLSEGAADQAAVAGRRPMRA